MQLEIRCFANLADKAPKGNALDVPEGATAASVMTLLGITPDDVKLIFVNGTHVEIGRVLNEHDRVAFIPAVGGG